MKRKREKIKVGYYLEKRAQTQLHVLALHDRRSVSQEVAWLIVEEVARRRVRYLEEEGEA